MMLLRAKNVNWDLRVFQFGVVSIGPVECDNSNYPALYTKVKCYFNMQILNAGKSNLIKNCFRCLTTCPGIVFPKFYFTSYNLDALFLSGYLTIFVRKAQIDACKM
jgi:secreted trypsin-like serine protease